MISKSQFNINGNVSLYELPPDFTYLKFKALKDKDKYLYDRGYNLVVSIGLNRICDLMVGATTTSFTYCGVGTGTSAAAAYNTDLETPLSTRKLITDRWRGNATAYFSTFFDKDDNAGTWTETIIANASSAGDILCRRKFASSFPKTTSNAAVVEWQVALSAVADS